MAFAATTERPNKLSFSQREFLQEDAMGIKNYSAVLLLQALFVLTSCGVNITKPLATENDGDARCTGFIDAPLSKLEPIADTTLLASALGQPDSGKLCMGEVFQVKQPVTVYRVWEKSKSYSVYGRWWTFDPPQGTLEQYRIDYEICSEWGARDTTVSCQLTKGAKIVVGTGQSMACNTVTYPVSAHNQVFVPNDSRNNILYVENCAAYSYP